MILITGCARSGTSLTTGIIQACGASLGSSVNALNEAKPVRDGLVKPWLKDRGCDPLGQYPLPPEDRNYTLDPDWRGKVVAALGNPSEPWAYKGAKMCLMWEQWVDAFPEATWVIVRRDKDRIIDSCLRTGFMRAYQNREGWGEWVDYHVRRFDELKEVMGDRCIEVWPGTTAEAFEPLITSLEAEGLTWDEDAVAAQISPEKWHA